MTDAATPDPLDAIGERAAQLTRAREAVAELKAGGRDAFKPGPPPEAGLPLGLDTGGFSDPKLQGLPTQGIDALLGGGLVGATKFIAGIPQTVLDVGGLLSPTVAKGANAYTTQVDKIVQGMRPPPSTLASVGEGLGETLPYAAVGFPKAAQSLVGAILQGSAMGAGAGATAYQEDTNASNRLAARGVGAVGGAAGGGIAGAITGTLTRMLGAKGAVQAVRTVEDEVGRLDPALADARGTINAQVARLQQQHENLGARALAAGDRMGPLQMDTVAPKLQTLLDSTDSMISPDKSAVGVLKQVRDVLAPEREVPQSLVVGGRKFELTPAGQYVREGGGSSLPQPVVEQILSSQGVSAAPQITYSKLRQATEGLDNFLAMKKDSSDQAVKAVREAQKLVEGRLDEFHKAVPGVAERAQAAQNFYEKNIAAYDKPVVKEFLAETDPLAKANRAIDIALGKDKASSEAVAGLIGADGRAAIEKGLMKKSLDAAMNDEGLIDAARFATFLRDKPGAAPYLTADTQKMFDGVKNLLTESSLRAGKAPVAGFARPAGSGYGWVLAMEQLAHNQPLNAATTAAAATIVNPTFQMIDRLLGDRFGRTLLAASAATKPGSPRMARVVQQIATRFVEPAAGVGAAEVGGMR